MEFSLSLSLKILGVLLAILMVLSTFSTLSWLMKLRIIACIFIGFVLIGVLHWPLVEPDEPFGIVTMPGFKSAVVLATTAFLTGLIAYFLAWPYGLEIGVLAVPAGLSVWAVCSGSIGDLMLRTNSVQQRAAILTSLKWEPIFWLAVVAIGFVGALVGQVISKRRIISKETEKKTNSKINVYSNVVTALVGSALIALFCMRVLAQDVRIFDSRFGSVVAQPAVGQIAFAVFTSFAIASFVVKKFLGAHYVWTLICTVFLPAFCIIFYAKPDVLSYMSQTFPPVFFTNPIIAILPIQMVAFGVLGSLSGYWLVVRYDYWKEHERE